LAVSDGRRVVSHYFGRECSPWRAILASEPFLQAQCAQFLFEALVVGNLLKRLAVEFVLPAQTGEFCAPRVTFIRIFECLSDLQEEDARPVAGDAIGMVVEEASYEPADPVALLSVVFGGTGVVE